MKTLQASDLFLKNWTSLCAEDAWRVVCFMEQLGQLVKRGLYTQYGYYLKALLRVAAVKKHRKTLRKLDPEQLVDIYHDTALFFHQPFYHFHISKIKVHGRTLLAPEEQLADVSFYHFIYIDAAFSKLGVLQHAGEDVAAAVREFIATLYLPQTPRGGKVTFDRQLVDVLADGVQLLPWQQTMIIRAYANTRQYMVGRCPTLFPQVEAHEGQEDTAPVHTGVMWRKLHFDLAKSDVFPSYDGAGAANVYDVLDYLELEAVANLKRKRDE